MKTLEELQAMSIDEKIDMAINELNELNDKKETREIYHRKEDIKLALQGWWAVKDSTIRWP